jgi:TatD DNase family protein
LAQSPGVLHSFSADLESAYQALEMNFFIGITGPVTFKNAPDLRQVVQEVPIEDILIETDSPFLTPHPYRGKRNEPAYVRFVAEKIAELKDISVDVIGIITSQNAEKLFGWSVLA